MYKKASVYKDPSVPRALGGVQPFAKASGLSTKKAQQLLQQRLSYKVQKPHGGAKPPHRCCIRGAQ